MRWTDTWVFALALVGATLAGCMGEDGPGDPTGNEGSQKDQTQTEPFTLLDHNWTHDNLMHVDLVEGEPVIGTFEVEVPMDKVVVHVERYSLNAGIFADNLRLRDPGGNLVDQNAFSDQQVGNIDSTGNASVDAAKPVQGTWTVTLSTSNIAGTDEGRTVVTAHPAASPDNKSSARDNSRNFQS